VGKLSLENTDSTCNFPFNLVLGLVVRCTSSGPSYVLVNIIVFCLILVHFHDFLITSPTNSTHFFKRHSLRAFVPGYMTEGLDGRGSRFRFSAVAGNFSLHHRTALGPTQPPIQWIPGTLSLGVKRPGCLVKHRDNFTLP